MLVSKVFHNINNHVIKLLEADFVIFFFIT